MKTRWTTFLALVTLSAFFAAAGILAAADKQEVPDEVKIENKGYKKDKKGPVILDHKKHHEEYKVACTECHHEYKDGKNVWKEGDLVKKCVECHDPVKTEGKVKKLQLAMHAKCKTCHKTLVKEGKSKKAPYKKCKKCHQKK